MNSFLHIFLNVAGTMCHRLTKGLILWGREKKPFLDPFKVLLAGLRIKLMREVITENIKFNFVCMGISHTWEGQTPHVYERFKDRKENEVCMLF